MRRAPASPSRVLAGAPWRAHASGTREKIDAIHAWTSALILLNRRLGGFFLLAALAPGEVLVAVLDCLLLLGSHLVLPQGSRHRDSWGRSVHETRGGGGGGEATQKIESRFSGWFTIA
jgi:hypothetical protein